MKTFIDKYLNFNRVEFWAATTLFVFAVFFHISNALQITGSSQVIVTSTERLPFDYYFVSTLIKYGILYINFLFLSLVVVPKLVRKENVLQNILFIILTFLVTGIVFGVLNTFLKYNMVSSFRTNAYTHNLLLLNGFLYALRLLLMFSFYSVLKYTSLYMLSKAASIQARFPFITPGSLVAIVAWVLSLFVFSISEADTAFIAAVAIIPPSFLILYWFTFHFLIPLCLRQRKPIRAYAIRMIFVVFILAFPLGIFAMLITEHEDQGAGIGTFNFFLQLLVTAPLCWVLFKRKMKGNEELYTLKKELGQTHANFDFLRSQINPHFLFNALNTIYGTALQEKAERTSEGIEKLGDMMRFMLQENMQQQISLAREIDYLNNYISLQKLRTDPNPSISITTAIEPQISTIQIAPMLLIPFVENAFKHGISFREPSYIKVTLEVRSNTLYFDVYNSKHTKPENDPEKNKSGIGLNNVKQRLQLLYAGKHELIIRETGKDFFIHLTIQLS